VTGTPIKRTLTPEQKAAAVERTRRWRIANPGRRKATDAKWREQNRENERRRHREYKAANLEKERDRERQISQRNWMVRNHGIGYAEVFAEMWQAQDGCCYLCQRELARESAELDHDHRCCPKNATCSECRRGLACGHCNKLIGFAGDDPDRLRLIAANLELARLAFESRTTTGAQLQLPVEATDTTTAGYAAVDMSAFAPTVNAIPSPLPPEREAS
jgi:hypothetical protein